MTKDKICFPGLNVNEGSTYIRRTPDIFKTSGKIVLEFRGAPITKFGWLRYVDPLYIHTLARRIVLIWREELRNEFSPPPLYGKATADFEKLCNNNKSLLMKCFEALLQWCDFEGFLEELLPYRGCCFPNCSCMEGDFCWVLKYDLVKLQKHSTVGERTCCAGNAVFG